jgi:hypothetical protein
MKDNKDAIPDNFQNFFYTRNADFGDDEENLLSRLEHFNM